MPTPSTPVLQLIGRSLMTVRYDGDCQEWVFVFSDRVVLQVSAPWRVLADGAVALGWGDHGQWFGLSEPVDAPTRLRTLTASGVVAAASHDGPGDLAVTFENECTLQVFNASSGYEGWILNGPGGRWLVAQGGGRVSEGGRPV